MHRAGRLRAGGGDVSAIPVTQAGFSFRATLPLAGLIAASALVVTPCYVAMNLMIDLAQALVGPRLALT